jgi:acyl-CoA thioester hydrolase
MSHRQRQSDGPNASGEFAVWVPVAVRYSDLDQQGHVNNAVYFTYFEQGRLGYFDAMRRLARAAAGQAAPPAPRLQGEGSSGVAGARALPIAPGATDDRLELPLVVSEASCVYLRPIASLAPVSVGVRAARIGHASIDLEYAIRSAPDGPLYATGGTTIVCVDLVSGRPRGLPPWTVAALRQLESGAQGSPSAEEGDRR